jgi:putative nucleotidyltransferase with HDIG domain
MPGMSGANLLSWVRRYHSGTIRFMLSGQFDAQAGLRTVPVAHQFLSKPCLPETLIGTLERACNLQNIIPNDVIRKVSAAVGSLPHNPAVYSRLSAAIQEDRVSVQAISTIIEQDVSLTMKVLQLANSSYFALAQQIDSIGGAIQSLGLDLLQQLVLAVEVFERVGIGEMAPGFSHERLQAHSMLTAQIAQTILACRGLAYSASVAALLHDIGQVVLACELPEAYGRILSECREGAQDLSVLERALLGASHAEVGAYLAGLWGFPDAVVRAILHHHDTVPADLIEGSVDSDGKLGDLDLIVSVADHLAGEGHSMPSLFTPYLPGWSAAAKSLAKQAG